MGKDLDGERSSHNISKERLADREDQINQLNKKIEGMIKQNNEDMQRLKTEHAYR